MLLDPVSPKNGVKIHTHTHTHTHTQRSCVLQQEEGYKHSNLAYCLVLAFPALTWISPDTGRKRTDFCIFTDLNHVARKHNAPIHKDPLISTVLFIDFYLSLSSCSHPHPLVSLKTVFICVWIYTMLSFLFHFLIYLSVCGDQYLVCSSVEISESSGLGSRGWEFEVLLEVLTRMCCLEAASSHVCGLLLIPLWSGDLMGLVYLWPHDQQQPSV